MYFLEDEGNTFLRNVKTTYPAEKRHIQEDMNHAISIYLFYNKHNSRSYQRISSNLIIEIFTKSCQNFPILVKVQQK
jgi:hypothetical protein